GLAGYSSCWMPFGPVRSINHNSWSRFWTSTSGRPAVRACGRLKEFVHCRPTPDLLLTLPRLCASSLSGNCRSPESVEPGELNEHRKVRDSGTFGRGARNTMRINRRELLKYGTAMFAGGILARSTYARLGVKHSSNSTNPRFTVPLRIPPELRPV